MYCGHLSDIPPLIMTDIKALFHLVPPPLMCVLPNIPCRYSFVINFNIVSLLCCNQLHSCMHEFA